MFRWRISIFGKDPCDLAWLWKGSQGRRESLVETYGLAACGYRSSRFPYRQSIHALKEMPPASGDAGGTRLVGISAALVAQAEVLKGKPEWGLSLR